MNLFVNGKLLLSCDGLFGARDIPKKSPRSARGGLGEAQDGPSDSNTDEAGNQQVGWGIGRGRFIKKVGSIVQNFKSKCEELDEKKQQERAGKPTDVELLCAAGYDVKSQIEAEFLQIAEQQAHHMKKLNLSSRLSTSRAQDENAEDI